MLATSQEQIEMRMTLANAETRTVQMNNQLKKIDDIVDKTEKLLYQMIPQNVAERLRKGVNPMDTVEVFESVTMLFSGMFNEMIILLIGSSDSSDQPKQCFTVLPEPNRTSQLKFCFPNRNRAEPNI